MVIKSNIRLASGKPFRTCSQGCQGRLFSTLPEAGTADASAGPALLPGSTAPTRVRAPQPQRCGGSPAPALAQAAARRGPEAPRVTEAARDGGPPRGSLPAGKKRKEGHEEPVQKKKKVKSSSSQTIIKVEKDVQSVIKTEDDDQLETKTKVRKKENLEDDECLDQLELKKKKKKNKKKKVGSELLEEAHSESFVNVEGHLDSEPQEESEKQIKILRKKKKKDQCHSSLSLENNQSSDTEFSSHHTDEEKTVAGKNHGTDIIQSDEESYVRRKKRKKKKDKSDSFLPLADNEDNVYGVPDSPTALSDFRKRQRKNFQEITLTDRKEEDINENSGSIRETKRKKKRSKDVSSLICEDDQDYSHRVPDKHLPAQQGVESEDEELSGKKCRKNIKDNNEEHVDDVTVVQEKKGNCDEVNIDKVRRQALQEEIDRESGKTKVFSPKVERDTKFGQWSTAAFQSSEEEMKFFRLMGGFKKGSVPIQNLSATTNKPNMALNREGEKKLQQALKMEFDKAMDLKQHRGIGLGFQPAANKKVYIDKYASRSIKFED
ncbi:PREDICTED: lysine-rich nucleolar protein 1 [Nipponia nippon]|uniref:lysine-rich nucleolar protein 1 n=1 Tax=Nipponia nippon TaxID=128390 RepID=UPI0005111256|nr:PREDICTED: lysine-rich nucleolar protein 1 [Nipponia nippon]